MRQLGLVILQWVVVLIYAKNGYLCKDPDLAYQWGVFFSVSNQVITTAWIYLCGRGKWKFYGIIFGLGLALIWANYYIPPLYWVVRNYKLFKPILTYAIICLIITFLINFKEK